MNRTYIDIVFHPGGRVVRTLSGVSLIEAAAQAGFVVDAPCGGAGTCGKCRVRFERGAPEPVETEQARLSSQELEEGIRLACQTRLYADATVHVPSTSLFGRCSQIQADSDADQHRDVDGDIRKAFIALPQPTLGDETPDLERVARGLSALGGERQAEALRASPSMLRELGAALRTTGFAGSAVLRGNALLDFEAGDETRHAYALAFDIGTTTLAGALLRLDTGAEAASTADMNPQTAFGDDVLSRIAYAGRGPEALEQLRACLADALRDMTRRLCADAGVQARHVYGAALAGNTTMQHLLCGFDPTPLGAAPFVPLHGCGLELDARDLDLGIHPRAQLYVFPVIGGFVGGDTAAGMLAAGLTQLDGPALMVDIGTNGEIVLAHEGKLWAASTAAGPAFEGARISCGMRAANGAIEKVFLNHDLELSAIGGTTPIGICGSGLIDLCGQLIKGGCITPDGRLLTRVDDAAPALQKRLGVNAAGEAECLLYESEARRIVLTQRDVRELQLGAGAIRAGMQILLKQQGLGPGDLKQVLIAGGFGSFIRRDNAQRIGLIPPELPHERIRFVGNVAFSGAKWAAVSRQARLRAETLARETVHVELSQDPDFALEFAMAMQFPTDLCGT